MPHAIETDPSGRPESAEPLRWAPPGSVLAVGVTLLLTLLLASWVVRAPSERLFGNEIAGRFHDPYTVALQFEKPRPPSLYTQPLTDYVGAVVARFTGGIAAYNVVVLASFPLAAWFGYLFAFRLSRSRSASTLAALAFALSPFHLAHAAYHPHIAQVQWLPAYLLALLLALEAPTWRRLLLLATALGAVALSNFYGGFIALVLTPFVLLAASLAPPDGVRERRWRRLATIAALFVALGVAGWLYVRLVAPAVLDRPASLAFPERHLARYTAHAASYVVSPIEHSLLGGWARGYWQRNSLPGDAVEQQLTLGSGFLLLALAAIGLRFAPPLRRRLAVESGERPLAAVPLLSALALIALLCSLPPVWRILGAELPGPSAALHALAPMFRALARFGAVVGLAVWTLAGISFALLWRTRSSSTRAAAATLLALGAFELWPLPPRRGRDVLPTAAHGALRDRGATTGLLVLDCVRSTDRAEKAVPALFGKGLRQLPATSDCAEPGLPGKLAALGFTHLIVRRASDDGALFLRRAADPGLALEAQFDDSLLYSVVAPAATVSVDLASGFHPRQYHSDRSYRWLADSGRLRLENRTSRPLEATLTVTLHAISGERRVVARIGGDRRVELGVAGNEPRPFRIEAIRLPPGRTTIELGSVEPAVIADELLHNGDRRRLSLALWEWSVETRPVDAR